MFAATCVCLCLAADADTRIPGSPPLPRYDEVNCRAFLIPIWVDPDRDDIREVRLYVSSSESGGAWRLVDSVPPYKKGFRFVAPRDGVYRFQVQAVPDAGSREPIVPADHFEADSRNALIVRVATEGREKAELTKASPR
jgi:hypothetical protein